MTAPPDADLDLAAVLQRIDVLEAEVRLLREKDTSADPKVERRRLLRLAKSRFYRYTPRTTAAQAIAEEWAEFERAPVRCSHSPETMAAIFAELRQKQIPRVSPRTITDDLDEAL